MTITFKDKTVYFTTKPVVFKFEIGDLLELDDCVVIRLNIPADNATRHNVFAMQKDAKLIWQIESALNKYPEIEVELPYENISLLNNGNVSVSDFFGRTFEVDIKNGKLIKFKVTR